jgi:hypothetical protein
MTQLDNVQNQNLADITAIKAAFNADLARAAAIKAQLESMKPLYDELDAIVVRVSKHIQKVHNVGNTVFTIVDNFEAKNTVFRPCGVKRFELLVETSEEHAETLMKAAKKAAKAAKDSS